MNYYSIPTFLTSFLVFMLGLTIYVKGQRNKASLIYFLLSLSIFTWLFFVSIGYNCPDLVKAELYMRICYLGIVFIPITTLHFDIEFLRILSLRFMIPILYGVGFLFWVLVIKTNYIVNGLYKYFWGVYPKAGLLHPVFLIFVFFVASISIMLLISNYFRIHTSSIRKIQIKYILMAYFFLLLSTVDFIQVYGVSLYTFGYLPVTIFLIFIAYATIKYRLLDIAIAITRTGIFVVVYSLVLGIPLILANVFRKYLVGFLGDNWWYVPMGLLIVFATVGPFIYIFINKKAEDRLLREQKRYQHTLRQASGGMTRIRDLKRLLNLIVHIVTKAVKIEFASIFLFDSENNHYRLLAIRDSTNVHPSLSLEKDSSIVERLYTKREPIVYEETQLQAQDMPNDLKLNTLEKQLKEINAAVVVPSFVSSKLLGFIVLGRKLSGKTYSQDDLNVLMVLANQMALAIENALSYQELTDTRNKLVQLEKLAITSKLARTIAHEIKNPLTAVKTFTEYLDEKYENKEFRQKFKYIINSEMDRLQNIASKLSDVGKASAPRFKDNVDAHQIIENIHFFLEKESHNQKIKLTCELKAKKFSLRADSDQLKQCFLNLILNSMQALQDYTASEKQITVITDNPQGTAKLVIEIIDTGPGIPETELSRIFEPFFTTKEKGTGLGLAVVQGIILAHNGKISCQSQVNQGTTFRIELPLETGVG